ncbi:hypothetical protein LXL04_016905 [Taraxacum kok-saghyz]
MEPWWRAGTSPVVARQWALADIIALSMSWAQSNPALDVVFPMNTGSTATAYKTYIYFNHDVADLHPQDHTTILGQRKKRMKATEQLVMLVQVRAIIKFENGGTNLDRYKSHDKFRESWVSFPKLIRPHFLSISIMDVSRIESPISYDEVNAAIWAFGSERAPQPRRVYI